jgi:hypothetical protein
LAKLQLFIAIHVLGAGGQFRILVNGTNTETRLIRAQGCHVGPEALEDSFEWDCGTAVVVVVVDNDTGLFHARRNLEDVEALKELCWEITSV